MENGVCPKCQAIDIAPQNAESVAASVNSDSSVPTTTVTTVTTATKPNFKAKIIACVIVLAVLGGLYWGISHFLFSDSKEEQNPTFVMNMTSAEITLKDYVSYPSTLKFSYDEEDWVFVTNDNKRIKMESSFECQNTFGVTEKHEFVLVITYSDDYEKFTINQLYIDKQKHI